MRITRIEIDDDNLAHVTRHGVSIEEIEQVFFARPTVKRNREDRNATFIAPGETVGGSPIVVPFVVPAPGVARPVTAWRAGE